MKKILISMLVAAMLLSLASCSSSQDDTKETQKEDVTTETTDAEALSEEEPAQEPTEEDSSGESSELPEFSLPDVSYEIPDLDIELEPIGKPELSLPESSVTIPNIGTIKPNTELITPEFELSVPDFDFGTIEPFIGSSDFELISGLDEEELNEIIAQKDNLVAALTSALNLQNISVDVNEETGEIVLDSMVLFDFDSSELSASGKAYLDKFIDAYSGVVFGADFDGFISEVIIEGHTDSKGSDSYNQTLSQRRADAVKTYCEGGHTEVSSRYKNELKSVLVSEGLATTQPVLNSDGSVNDEASRRVSFRFIIDVESIIG